MFLILAVHVNESEIDVIGKPSSSDKTFASSVQVVFGTGVGRCN